MGKRHIALFIRGVILTGLFLFYSPTVLADGGENKETRIKEIFSRVREEITGSIEYKFFNHFHSAPQYSARFRNEGILKLDMDYDWRQVNINLTPEIYFTNWPLSAGMMDKFEERDKERYIANLKEGYAIYYGDNFNLSIGKKIYSWGKADGYNPTDSINPYDFLDVPDNEKIGVFSAALSYSFGNSYMDLVFIPTFTPSRLPDGDNRWAGNPGGDEQGETQGRQFNTIAYTLSDREIPGRQMENSQFAIRFGTTIRGWDLSLSYYDGFDSVAVVRKDIEDGEIYYTPIYSRIHKIGADFSTTFGKIEIHGEMAHRFTLWDRDDDFFQYIIGGNYSWDELPIVSEYMEQITLVLEYAGESVTEAKKDPNISGSAGYTRPFTNSILTKLIFKFSEEDKIEVGSAININDGDYILQPKWIHKITDSLKFETGVDILNGKDDSFFGKWSRNDRAFTFLTYLF